MQRRQVVVLAVTYDDGDNMGELRPILPPHQWDWIDMVGEDVSVIAAGDVVEVKS